MNTLYWLFKVEMCEHSEISVHTRKRGDGYSAIKDCLFCHHLPGFDNFFYLATNNNNFKVT